MSKEHDDEYNEKNIEYHSDNGDYFTDAEDEEVVATDIYEEIDFLSDKTEILRNYSYLEGLPLCQYLNCNLLVEFFEKNN